MDGASEGRAHVIESARKRQPELKSATTRRGWKAALACVLAGGVFCVAARAQPEPAGQSQPLPAESGSLAVSMEPSVDALLSAFEAGPQEEYRLGAGDEVEIDVAGRPELTRRETVGPDGRITMPLPGEIRVAGLTRREAEATIEASLRRYYIEPSVSIVVSRYASNRVLLLGAVQHPGQVTLDDQPTLLEALAGGGTLTAGSNNALNKTQDLPERCEIFRGGDRMVWVNVKRLVETGNSLANLRLERGDVVFVPSPDQRYVTVLGQVTHPGAIPVTDESTIAEVIAQAGGLLPSAGGNPRVHIFDPATKTQQVVTFNNLKRATKKPMPALPDGSIVFVPESGLAKVGYVLQQFGPFADLGTLVLLTYHP